MEFALSEEQEILSDSVKKMLNDNVHIDLLRNHSKGGEGIRENIRKIVVEMGLPGLLIPEEYGGSGLGVLEASLIAEEFGRYAVPTPWIGNSAMAPTALLFKKGNNLAEKWLPLIASGEIIACVALTEAVGKRSNAGLELEGLKVSGTSIFAIDGELSPRIIITVAGENLILVDTESPGVTISEIPTIDSTRPVVEIIFDSVDAEIIPGGKNAIQKTINVGRVLLAADILGASSNMIEKAVEYSLDRKQFDRAIGSFQAVKHMCAEMAADLEPCRSLLWYAAYAQDNIEEEADLLSCHVKAHLSEVGQDVARVSTQVFGGMGFTDLLGIHYWFKRIGLSRQILGGPEKIRQEAAKIQGFLT
tara:strand:+ start:2083 stop:3165 length:1083 start_codon:yes stop_codon:yes gene_type:complete